MVSWLNPCNGKPSISIPANAFVFELEEDEDEFSNDGGFDGKPHFEWGDEPEDDNLFEGDEWKPNQKLAEANERYKSEVKKMNTKKKKDKK